MINAPDCVPQYELLSEIIMKRRWMFLPLIFLIISFAIIIYCTIVLFFTATVIKTNDNYASFRTDVLTLFNKPTSFNAKYNKLNGSTFVNTVLSNTTESSSGWGSKAMKLVCYYTVPTSLNSSLFFAKDIDPLLCTHVIVGFASLENCSIILDDILHQICMQAVKLKIKNKVLKVLLSIGGGGQNGGFSFMIKNHQNRKIFIQSLKKILKKYGLDGVDFDWEFPEIRSQQTVINDRERQHFTQLLREVYLEYKRENKEYLLTVAVAAQQTIVDMSYDISEMNKYVDFVNIMTYDFHFYSKYTPFTGLNAPLYSRPNEHAFWATLNTNYTINYWLSKGIDKQKIIVGLPTYGHSFTLVNPENSGLTSPACDFGHLGKFGFTTYADVCWFVTHNIFVQIHFDLTSCSPYMSSGFEWISFENEQSLECKANYIKSNFFGGAMMYSLNADDYNASCSKAGSPSTTFPLIRKVRSILFNDDTRPIQIS